MYGPGFDTEEGRVRKFSFRPDVEDDDDDDGAAAAAVPVEVADATLKGNVDKLLLVLPLLLLLRKIDDLEEVVDEDDDDGSLFDDPGFLARLVTEPLLSESGCCSVSCQRNMCIPRT